MFEYLGMVDIGWTMIINLINFIILFLVLRRLLFKPVTQFMAKRQEQIENDLNEAKQERQSAQTVKQEYEVRLREARQEAQHIMDRARQQGEKLKEELLQTARDESARLMQRAQEDIQREREKAIQQLRGEVAALAVLAAQKVLQQELNPANHRRLVNEFVDKVGKLS